MTPETHNLYEVLNVAEDASHDEIQAAYYQQVRKHPPEKDSDGFQRITRAFEVLGQESSRKEYDETARTDAETQRLIEEGRELLDSNDEDALIPLKRALMRSPESPMIRDLVVQALMLNEEWEDAQKQGRKVLYQEPGNPAYHMRLGDILRAQDEHGSAGAYYCKAMELDSANPTPTVRYAWSLVFTDRESDAVTVLTEAVHRDGKVDFDDFQYFHALCQIHSRNSEWGKLEQVHERIREIIPPDSDTRSYVAWFYYMDAMAMAQAGAMEGAVRAIEEAAAINDSLPDLQRTRKKIKGAKLIIDQAIALRDDEDFSPAFRCSVAFLIMMRAMGGNEALSEAFGQAAAEVLREAEIEDIDIEAQIKAVMIKYITAITIARDYLKDLREMTQDIPKRFRQVSCPSCYQKAIVGIPSVERLISAGVDRAKAENLLSSVSTDEILSRLDVTCEGCGTGFNGLGTALYQNRGPSQQVAPRGPCFVVTAACGDEQAFPVVVFREWRDRVLTKSLAGRAFIRAYQVWGPWTAHVVRNVGPLRRVSLKVLTRVAGALQASARK